MNRIKPLGFAVLFLSTSAGAQVCNSNPASTPNQAFSSQKNATVIQKSSHLMWAKCSVGQTPSATGCQGKAASMRWQDAQQAASDSKLAGFDNWRLPTIAELEGIVETQCHDPAVNLQVFPNTPSGGYWSSSQLPRLKTNAKVLFFFYGEPSNFYKDNPYHVRLVRDAS